VDGYSGERSLLARFPSGQSAARAAGELREAGYHAVQVERISHYGSPAGDADLYPGGGEITGMTIFSSADGAAPYGGTAGQVNGGGEEGDSFLVTVVSDEGSSGQVKEIVEKYGATLS